MRKKDEEQPRFCGNCNCHNAYNYPEQVFCMLRFRKNKNPVVETLWRCEEWNLNSQECHCIEDAHKNRKP
jgi:hypothetical protein